MLCVVVSDEGLLRLYDMWLTGGGGGGGVIVGWDCWCCLGDWMPFILFSLLGRILGLWSG